LLAVNEALDKFNAVDPRKAELVKLRYFVGLNFEEAAAVLGIAEPTVRRLVHSCRQRPAAVFVPLTFGPGERAEFDFGHALVEVDGVEITLANKEFELLRVIMSRAGQVVTREEILAEVWNDPAMKTSKTLDMHMSWLRRKLAAGGEAGRDVGADQRISTVRGVGFRFEAD